MPEIPQDTLAPTIMAIERSYEDMQRDQRRPHLGASLIGRECDRELWLTFRWAAQAQHSGRMLRLFETGNLEEKRLISDLRRIGVTVMEIDPDDGRQWRVEALNGHFAGSMDGVGLGFEEAPKTWHVIEFKSFNAKSFARLQAKGLQAAKPEHWAQVQVYMHLAGIERGFYLAVCKNDDSLYQERVKPDHVAQLRLMERARRIIFSARPPVRINDDGDKLPCRWCDYRHLCFAGRLPDVNCRTCLHSTPMEDGSWHCARWNETLSLEVQKVGCPNHLHIPDLVPGRQVDAGQDRVEYLMEDGSTWVDGFAPVEIAEEEMPL